MVERIADRVVLRGEMRERGTEKAADQGVMPRQLILMTLMPDADVREVITALAGDLAMVPWARAWPPGGTPRAFGDWRQALGPHPLEELQAVVLRARRTASMRRGTGGQVAIGRLEPLKVSSADGTLIRVPDTPVNRAAFGSTGTGDDRRRPAAEGAAAERRLHPCPARHAARPGARARPPRNQKLLDTAMEQYPHLFTGDRIWLLDRNFPGAPRIAA